MTAPRKMLGSPHEHYKTLEGNIQPMFFDREHMLRNWNLVIKNTPHIQTLEKKKQENETIASNIKHYG